MNKETEKFYKNFCQKTQSKNGMWEQRFFTDGKLAPCWGYQVDETASVIYGIYVHYKYTKNEKFVKENLKMCEKAIGFLKKYVKQWLQIEDFEKDVVKKEIEQSVYAKKEKIHISYDLWEMSEGIHLYSLSSIYAAFESMIKIYGLLDKNISDFENNRLKGEKVLKSINELRYLQEEIKKYIDNNLYEEKTNTYFRNIDDKKMDISILGAVEPFNVFSAKDDKIENTVEKINLEHILEDIRDLNMITT